MPSHPRDKRRPTLLGRANPTHTDRFVPDKVALINLGCPKNLVDSEVMLGHLKAQGYELTTQVDEASVVVVNTCGFLKASAQESVDTLLGVAARKGKGPLRAVVAAGCLSQRYGADAPEALTEVDGFLGVGQAAELPDVVARVLAGERVARLKGPSAGFEGYGVRLHSQPGPTAYLKISEGCDRKCSFCVIPQIRGPMVSRRRGELLAEARQLAAQGIRELVLVGQDPTRYGVDLGERGLAGLLEDLSEIDELRWIRVMYLFPDRHAAPVLSAIARLPKVCPYVDMPLQHVARGVLRGMNRPGGGEEFLEMIQAFRAQRPGAFIRSTFIVGFPGETESDFAELLAFLEQARLDWVGGFRYSREEGAPSAALSGQLSPAVKAKRYRTLLKTQQRITREQLRLRRGSETEVLVETLTPEGLIGRCAGQAPEIDGTVLLPATGQPGPAPGDFIRARITGSGAYDLRARCLEVLSRSARIPSRLIQLQTQPALG